MRHAGLRIVASAVTILTLACDGGEPPRAASAAAASPTQQTATVAATVAEPPAVRVLTSRGGPVAGVAVSFVVSAGGGSIATTTQRTNEAGIASAGAWTLGTAAGDNTVVATVDGLADGTVTFRASAQAGAAAQLIIVTQPPSHAISGSPLSPAPVVRVRDRYGNDTPAADIAVTAHASDPTVALEAAVARTDANGVASFDSLRVHTPVGAVSLSFQAAGLSTATAQAGTTVLGVSSGGCPAPFRLDMPLGGMRRATLDHAQGLNCLDFDFQDHHGQQFLLLFENMPMYGGSANALFSAAFGATSPSTFSYTLQSVPRNHAAGTSLPLQHVHSHAAAATDLHSWDFGDGPIYELHPEEPASGVAPPMLLRSQGLMLDVNAAAADPQVGDTIVVRMEGIARLSIPTGNQRAVIRHISDELIFAEDVRLPTLQREDGGFNSPLHPDTMAAIAREYAATAKRQADMLFAGRYNNAIAATPGGRVVAVHSVMYASNIWGYTYSSGNYFVWDYWVGSTGGTRGGANQLVQRNADNLFMHEIAHMRELGILQQDPTAVRGYRWLTEGFARFSERLPIAARLLSTHDYSRTDNVRLPLNPIFGGSTYFRDDVPTFLNMTTSAMDGYQHSAWIFDYFADQVAHAGGDWRAAVRAFLLASGRPAALDGVVHSHLGISLPELFTRARIALFLDDIGTPGLPPWTQYLQYRLRESRPAGSGVDPRNAFRRLVPGEAAEIQHALTPGTAWGYVIDGSSATAGTRYILTGASTSNAVVSVTRIR